MNRVFPAFALAVAACVGWFVSGATHETGHALAAVIAGLKIVEFQPWALLGRVHVRFVGETTNAWLAIIHISGMLLAVVIGVTGVVAVTLIARKWRSAGLGIWFFLPMMCQCLAWLALPLACMLGARAPRDDVTKFMHMTGWPPWTVSMIGLVLALWCAQTLIWSFRQQKASKMLQRTGASRLAQSEIGTSSAAGSRR